MIATAPLSPATGVLAGGWPATSTSSVCSPEATPGMKNVPSACVIACRLVPRTFTTALASGLRLPSVTTPAIERVSAAGGGGGLTSETWSESAVAAGSSGLWRAVKPSAVTSIITLPVVGAASLNVPSAAVVAVAPPPATATVAFATALPSASVTLPVTSRVLPFGGAGAGLAGCGAG